MAAINLVKKGKEEVINMGPVQIYVLEDGKLTDNRLGLVRLTIAAKTTGPSVRPSIPHLFTPTQTPSLTPPKLHWHRMHDEGFYISKGTIRFHTEEGDVDASAGDFVMVPIKVVHSFSNPFEEPAEFLNTLTPGYYVDYLRMVAASMKSGLKMGEEGQKKIMAQFATFPPGDVGFEEGGGQSEKGGEKRKKF